MGDETEPVNEPTVLDLFSGIGGFSLAFESEGFRTIAFSEIDPAASAGRKREDQLPRRIFADASTVKTGGMSMSPEFRSWFMGYPPNWLKPLADVPGMQSCRRQSGHSQKPSTKS